MPRNRLSIPLLSILALSLALLPLAATAEEEERWHDISGQALVLLREKQVYSNEMLDALERHLEDCRSRSRESGGE